MAILPEILSRTKVASSFVLLLPVLLAITSTYAVASISDVSAPTDRAGVFMRVSTVAGSGLAGRKDGKAEEAEFRWPTGVGGDGEGNIYVSDYMNNLIRKISKNGEVSTLAGGAAKGYKDGVGTEALFHGPDNIATDKEGNIYIADTDNFRIRKITPEGRVTTVAGSGKRGYHDGEALKAGFGYPTGVVAFEYNGTTTLFIADRGSHTVRWFTHEGKVRTIVGNGYPGFMDGKGRATHLNHPISIAIAPDGTLYVADSGNNSIRRISTDGRLTTIAGSKTPGYLDGPGAEARFSWPTGIAVDRKGNIYVCDSGNNKIRRVSPQGVVSTIAGSTMPGSIDGPAYRASFNFPAGIWIDGDDIYIADSGNNKIRLIELKRGP